MFMGEIAIDMITAPFLKLASKECARYLVLEVWKLRCDEVTAMHTQRIGKLYEENS